MPKQTKQSTEKSSEPELVITRLLDAPRESVFQAWTDPERMMQWWGPKGFTAPYCTIDLRPGGVCHCCMRSPEGRDYWSKWIFQEIVEPERLVLLDSFSDAQGNTVSPAEYDMPDWPEEALMTITFEEQEGETRLTIHHAVSASLAECYQATQGWNESLDRLDEYLGALTHSGNA